MKNCKEKKKTGKREKKNKKKTEGKEKKQKYLVASVQQRKFLLLLAKGKKEQPKAVPFSFSYLLFSPFISFLFVFLLFSFVDKQQDQEATNERKK